MNVCYMECNLITLFIYCIIHIMIYIPLFYNTRMATSIKGKLSYLDIPIKGTQLLKKTAFEEYLDQVLFTVKCLI